jgi:ribosomal protein L27
MTGGFSTPRKDRGVKVASGQLVKAGTILSRGSSVYKAGTYARGVGTIFALMPGKVSFTKRKTPKGGVKTFIHIIPAPVAKK